MESFLSFQRLNIPDELQIVGALGAALCARNFSKPSSSSTYKNSSEHGVQSM